MAEQIKFKKNDDKQSLPESIDTGTLYFTYRDRDKNNTYVKSGQLYLDADSTNRLQISGVGYDAGNAAEIFNDYRIRVDNDLERKGNVATGIYSTASGLATTAEGSAAFAVGSGTTASGEASFAGGKNSFVNGDFSAGFGENTQVSGNGSFGIGQGTRAIGDYSFVGGQSDEYIDLKIASNLGNNQYKVTNLDDSSDYIDDTKQLTDLGKLSIGSIVFQINDSNNNQGSIAIVENKERNESNECIITLKKQDSTLNDLIFYTGTFQFVQGGAYSKNSFSYGKNCTVAGDNSFSGGNGVNVWGVNSIGWGSAETWNIEGDKLACQEKINEYTNQAEEYRQASEDATNPIIKGYYFTQYTIALFNKQGAESRLQKLNLYEVYEGVGNNSAVFGLNNSSLADGSLIAGKFNKSQGNNSLVIGEGNIAYYPNMTILGSFAKVDYSPNGLLNYDYITKTGTNNHTKVETYSFPQLLIGNGGLDEEDSNSFEVYKNGLVRASKSFRVLERGEIDQFSETINTTTYTGLRLVAFNSLLFLDSGSYVCPPPSKDGLLHLGAPLAKWNTVYTENILVNKYYYSKKSTSRAISIDECVLSSSLIYPMIQGFGGPNHRMLALDGGSSTMSEEIYIVPNPERTGTKHLGHNHESNTLRWKLFSSAINNSGNIANGGNITNSGTFTNGGGVTINGFTFYNNGIQLNSAGQHSGLLFYDDAATPLSGLSNFGVTIKLGKCYKSSSVDLPGIQIGVSHIGSSKLYVKDVAVCFGPYDTTRFALYPAQPASNITDSVSTGYIGYSSRRWAGAYLGTGAIVTSDERLKDICQDNHMDKLLKVYEKINPIAYSWIKRPKEDKRIHVGVSAQQVEQALLSQGLTSMDFAGLCYDEYSPEGDNSQDNLIDSNRLYSFRYEEFHGLHIMKNHQQDARLTALEEKNKELENTISELKTQIELFKLAIGG